jgi:hypothetical protein
MVFSSFVFMGASKFSIVPLNGLFMLTRYPDDIELMEDMLNEAYVQHILSETKRIFRWLEKKLLTN